MTERLFHCAGGEVRLPAAPLNDRSDGGNLVVLPPRVVWDRTALSRTELLNWSLLVAATAAAMLEVLPQLRGGCINYWDAGNWALNENAPPAGPKTGTQHRRLHLHLLGRSRDAGNPAWQWGEAPLFPRYADATSHAYRPLDAGECDAIVNQLRRALAGDYALLPA